MQYFRCTSLETQAFISCNNNSNILFNRFRLLFCLFRSPIKATSPSSSPIAFFDHYYFQLRLSDSRFKPSPQNCAFIPSKNHALPGRQPMYSIHNDDVSFFDTFLLLSAYIRNQPPSVFSHQRIRIGEYLFLRYVSS